MKISKAQLIATLEDMIARIRVGDSLEGNLQYSFFETLDPGMVEVSATYRTGNAMGQGGVRIIPTTEPEPTNG